MNMGVIIVENVALADFSGSVCSLVASLSISIQNISVINLINTGSPVYAVTQAMQVEFNQMFI